MGLLIQWNNPRVWNGIFKYEYFQRPIIFFKKNKWFCVHSFSSLIPGMRHPSSLIFMTTPTALSIWLWCFVQLLIFVVNQCLCGVLAHRCCEPTTMIYMRCAIIKLGIALCKIMLRSPMLIKLTRPNVDRRGNQVMR